MPLSAIPAHDNALIRFLKAHGILRRAVSGRPFLAAIGAPAFSCRRAPGSNVITLGGYYQLAVRRTVEGELEVGLRHGRRPDMEDAVFVEAGARPIQGFGDVRVLCGVLDGLAFPL
jgi:hypothetical protein